MKQKILITLAITLALAFASCSRISEQYRSRGAPPAYYCYTPQQYTQSVGKPITIYGNFDAYCDELYRIQVGSPTTHEKALITTMWLQQQDLDPDRETNSQQSRVVLRCIPSYQVASILKIIENMGIDKVWIQPDFSVSRLSCSQCLALRLPQSSCTHSPTPAPTTQINNYYYNSSPPNPPTVNTESKAAETEKPPVPCNVSAGNPGADSVTLSWNSAGSGICYKVYYSTRNDPSCAVAIGSLLSVAAVKINGLCSGTNYYFWITSVRNNRESEKSSVVSVKTAVVLAR